MDNRFITIKGWMIDDLGLAGYDLLCYATIYGFSQPNEKNRTVGEWNGTTQELADWVGCSQRQITNILKRLLDHGLIKITHELPRNGGEKTKCYVATARKKFPSQLGKNFTAGYEKISQPDPCPSLYKDNKSTQGGCGKNYNSSPASKKTIKVEQDSEPFGSEVRVFDVSQVNKANRQAYAEASEVAKELAKIYGNERAATNQVVSRVKVLLTQYSRFELSTAIRNAMKDSDRSKFQLKSLLSDDMVATLVRANASGYTTMRTI